MGRVLGADGDAVASLEAELGWVPEGGGPDAPDGRGGGPELAGGRGGGPETRDGGGMTTGSAPRPGGGGGERGAAGGADGTDLAAVTPRSVEGPSGRPDDGGEGGPLRGALGGGALAGARELFFLPSPSKTSRSDPALFSAAISTVSCTRALQTTVSSR